MAISISPGFSDDAFERSFQRPTRPSQRRCCRSTDPKHSGYEDFHSDHSTFSEIVHLQETFLLNGSGLMPRYVLTFESRSSRSQRHLRCVY